MLTVIMWMKLISIQMADISYQVVMTQHLKYGISDKDISFILSMGMKVNQHQLLFLHVVITLQLVALTQLWWYGRVTLKKMNKSLSKTLVLRIPSNHNQVVYQLHPRDHQQQLKKRNNTTQEENRKLIHQLNHLQEQWKCIHQLLVEMMVLEVVVRSLHRLLRK